MPTYDYKCTDCAHAFEAFHSMTAEPIKECPSCSGQKVKRLIGPGAGLIFKGSGFYITDYRSKSYNDAKKSDSPSNGAKTTPNSPKTESVTTNTKAPE